MARRRRKKHGKSSGIASGPMFPSFIDEDFDGIEEAEEEVREEFRDYDREED